MRHFPAFLDLVGRSALVIGAGPGARRRAGLLAAAGADVRTVAHFDESLLHGCAVAIGADAPDSELQALSTAARQRGIPVNIADRPELCSFIMPAIVDRDPITIAVSSGGTAPVLARLLRQRIERLVPPAFGRLATFVGDYTAAVRSRWPDLPRRRQLLERLYTGRVAELLLAGDATAARREIVRELDDTAFRQEAIGTVFLVGAGPGAADLLTLRAHRLLGEADVIVHDRLVGDEVLGLSRRDAERIDVGKRPDRASPSQDAINELLVRLATQHRTVVRLKGGDPFVFGRGGEEAAALTRAGVPFEVVPGITAALACAAQACIPLTQRGLSRSVILVTGHTSTGLPDLGFVVAALAGGTVAIYMGRATLSQLRDRLLSKGLAPDTPAVLIENGGTHQQRQLHGTLDSIAAAAPLWTAGGPALLLLGEAVSQGARNVGCKPPLQSGSYRSPRVATA